MSSRWFHRVRTVASHTGAKLPLPIVSLLRRGRRLARGEVGVAGARLESEYLSQALPPLRYLEVPRAISGASPEGVGRASSSRGVVGKGRKRTMSPTRGSPENVGSIASRSSFLRPVLRARRLGVGNDILVPIGKSLFCGSRVPRRKKPLPVVGAVALGSVGSRGGGRPSLPEAATTPVAFAYGNRFSSRARKVLPIASGGSLLQPAVTRLPRR